MAPHVVPPEEQIPGAFVRGSYPFDGVIQPEVGRYHVYISWACPWAQRVAIVRCLMGLQGVFSLGVVDPVRDERGWAFNDTFRDEVNGFGYLSQAYLATDTTFAGRPTVPTLWDKQEGRVVSNAFYGMTRMIEMTFEGEVDLYPEADRPAIDAIIDDLYRDVNNGVYRCGFATSQEAYDRAFQTLFGRLDQLDRVLGERRYLVGSSITEPDICLFTTLVRFDAVYHTHFKCNGRTLTSYPNLWPYARDLYQQPGFGETTDFDHIKRHYYLTHPHLNPAKIVAAGPLADWTEPTDRATLG